MMAGPHSNKTKAWQRGKNAESSHLNRKHEVDKTKSKQGEEI